jgi:hypothetical protein
MNQALSEQLSTYLSIMDERVQSYLSSALEHTQRYLAAAWSHLPEVAPYLPLIATTAAALVCLMLFMSLKVQIRGIQARLRAFEAKASNESIGKEPIVSEAEPEEERSMLMTVPRAGLDTTMRSKVLRMHRAGQSAGDIAASLRMPKGEVDLLVKVHEIELGSLEAC